MYVKPLVFSITRTSLHDGEGIRTVVYFKGCNMRCRWCHNPEGLKSENEIIFNKTKCIGCNICSGICPNVEMGNIDREKCIACGKCADVCPANALSFAGKQMTEKEILKVILKDREYYEKSGGGVTFSGGECLLYPEFMENILRMCKEENINTLVESAFNVPWENIQRVLPYTDMFYVDIKHMESDVHMEYTGCPNTRILDNIKKLSEHSGNFLIRIPVIPGVNDSKENLGATREFAKSLGAGVEELKYNNLARSKYESLSMEYEEFSV